MAFVFLESDSIISQSLYAFKKTSMHARKLGRFRVLHIEIHTFSKSHFTYPSIQNFIEPHILICRIDPITNNAPFAVIATSQCDGHVRNFQLLCIIFSVIEPVKTNYRMLRNWEWMAEK